MQLIGMLDSPYVRRVAITMRLLGLPFEHRPLSVFGDFETIRSIHPLVKVPTLVLPDGQCLIDSSLILEHLASLQVPGSCLHEPTSDQRVKSLEVLGVALAAMEKTALLIYERHQRPPELQHAPWIERNVTQLRGACDWLEDVVGQGEQWLFAEQLSQVDVTLAVAWRFIQLRSPGDIPASGYPGLCAYSARAEALQAFRDCPVD